MLIYSTKSGIITLNGKVLGIGYSGNGEGVNNPELEGVRMVGPIPRGLYTIRAPRASATLGPYVLDLEPDPGNKMQGRSLFRIHGDNSKLNRTASHGCIILSRPVREKCWLLNTDRLLRAI